MPILSHKEADRYCLPEQLRQEHPSIVLATVSPRRIELFSALGLPYRAIGADIDESFLDGEIPEEYVKRIALDKAQRVSESRPDSWVIGADTSVICDGKLLGKPSGSDDAKAMLQLLSGRGHEVLSGVAIVNKSRGICESAVACTQVFFRMLDKKEISHYVATGEPMDKAGAYGIQGEAGAFVERIEGSYTNVVGLPLELLRDKLCELFSTQSLRTD